MEGRKRVMDADKLDLVVELAIEAFWKDVANNCPEIKTGDMHPVESYDFTSLCNHVVTHWYFGNLPATKLYSVELDTTSLDSDFTEYLRKNGIKHKHLGDAFNGWVVRYEGTREALRAMVKQWWVPGTADELLDFYNQIKEVNVLDKDAKTVVAETVPKKKGKNYVGWIYIEKEPGLRDRFYVQYRDKDGVSQNKFVGIGAAAEACDWFETTLGHGPVKLEQTPMGLRVFVPEPGS